MKRIMFWASISVFLLSLAGCACRHEAWDCSSCLDVKDFLPPVVKEDVNPVLPQEIAQSPVIVEPDPVAAALTPSEPAAPVVASIPAPEVSSKGGAYHFGDYRSATLTNKAWQSLTQKDTQAVATYTDKCVAMYSSEASKMQATLNDYPSGEPQKVFSYWALNDVATSLYIQGEAYRKAGDTAKAKAAYERVIHEFSFGQAYDPASKSFWKPADGAREGLYMIEKGLDLDFGNMTSQALVLKMWESLAKKNLEEVIAYDMKLENLYGKTAREMQLPLKDYPSLPAEKIHMYWALNDVGTGVFVLAEAFNAAGRKEDAKKTYQRVISDYFYAQCWDPQGWFWRPAEAAQQKILEIEAVAP